MTGLADVTRVEVPLAAVGTAHAHLRRLGRQGVEGFAVWAGRQDTVTFRVEKTIIPAQRPVRDRHGGVGVLVDGSELHRLNRWLYEHHLTLVAQLHSHPGEAYHSPTDDAFPIGTAVGSLSLVIPDFARTPFHLNRCAVYRLAARGTWRPLDASQARALIRIEG